MNFEPKFLKLAPPQAKLWLITAWSMAKFGNFYPLFPLATALKSTKIELIYQFCNINLFIAVTSKIKRLILHNWYINSIFVLFTGGALIKELRDIKCSDEKKKN